MAYEQATNSAIETTKENTRAALGRYFMAQLMFWMPWAATWLVHGAGKSDTFFQFLFSISHYDYSILFAALLLLTISAIFFIVTTINLVSNLRRPTLDRIATFQRRMKIAWIFGVVTNIGLLTLGYRNAYYQNDVELVHGARIFHAVFTVVVFILGCIWFQVGVTFFSQLFAKRKNKLIQPPPQ